MKNVFSVLNALSGPVKKINIREIEYVCICVHFKDLKRLEWLETLCTVCTRESNVIWLSQRSFGCVPCITKYSFEIELQLMITTMSKSIQKFEVLEMDASASVLNFHNIPSINTKNSEHTNGE